LGLCDVKNRQLLDQTISKQMKKCLPLLAVALLLMAISPVAAIPVHGTFNGVVTGVNGSGAAYPIGTPVTGSYGYDPDLLDGNQTTYNDPSVFFFINIGGQPFAYYLPLLSGLSFSVDANGMPVFGGAAGVWDLYISGNFLGLRTGPGSSFYINSQVTYDAPTVPDAGTASFLMGIALASVVVARRFIR
jgi:hypothetical protein